MAKGVRSVAVDFDDLFDPDVNGDGPSVANLRGGGTPLRYAALSYGSKRADVGYRQAGVDVSNLWAAKGTAVYALPFNGLNYTAGNGAPTNSTGSRTASRSISINPDGTWTVPGAGSLSDGGATSGRWLATGQQASQWEVLFAASVAWVGEQYGRILNGAPDYTAVSTNRSFTVSATIQADTRQDCEGDATVVVYLRNTATGQKTTSTIHLRAQATGWV